VMLAIYVTFLTAMMLLTWRSRAVIWAFCVSWLFSCLPITLGLIEFPYLRDTSNSLTWFLCVNALAFFFGVMLFRLQMKARMPRRVTSAPEYQESTSDLRLTKILWFVSLLGTFLVLVDFFISGGASTSGLGELRENVTSKESATIFGQLGSLLTWPGLYVYFFALTTKRRLGRFTSLWLLGAAIMYFVPAVLTAGRQATFQLVIITFMAYMFNIHRGRYGSRSKNLLTILTIVSVAATYMLYIAVARVEIWTTSTKEDILVALFNFRISNGLDYTLSFLPLPLRSAIVEGILYFSHTPALLETFLERVEDVRFYGANSQPFVFRRILFLTGIDPASAYTYKVALLDNSGLVGVGWSTAYSGLILDFGRIGVAVSMFVLGAAGQIAWNIEQSRRSVDAKFLYVIIILNIVYLPTSIGISDTNVFLCLLFIILKVLFFRPLPNVHGPAASLPNTGTLTVFEHPKINLVRSS
jgi:oligosaccharide repeat unit polymerase